MLFNFIFIIGYYSSLNEILNRVFVINLFIILPVALFIFFIFGRKINLKNIIINLIKTVGTWIVCFFVDIIMKMFIGMLTAESDISGLFEIEDTDYLTLPKIGGLFYLARVLIFFYAYTFMFIKRSKLNKKRKRTIIITLLIITVILGIVLWFVYPYFIKPIECDDYCCS